MSLLGGLVSPPPVFAQPSAGVSDPWANMNQGQSALAKQLAVLQQDDKTKQQPGAPQPTTAAPTGANPTQVAGGAPAANPQVQQVMDAVKRGLITPEIAQQILQRSQSQGGPPPGQFNAPVQGVINSAQPQPQPAPGQAQPLSGMSGQAVY